MGGSPVVLVVEDEWFLRECSAAHLRMARWRILEAPTGEAALSLLAVRNRIDVVFTDIRLGGAISSWEVGAGFRRVLPRIPVIYTSGTAVALDRAVPMSRFIPKPYEPDAIVDACRTSLQGGGCP